jgi:hypothetical protein
MNTVTQEWIRYGLRVAIVWSNGSVSIGTVVSGTDSSVFVQADGERHRFRKHSLVLFGSSSTHLEQITPALIRRADLGAEIRKALITMRKYVADPRLRTRPDVDQAMTALIELRDQITARIAALCELDRP